MPVSVADDAEVLWKSACTFIREQVSESVWFAVFNETSGRNLDEQCLTISVPSSFIRERIEQRYRAMSLAAVADAGHPGLGLEIHVETDLGGGEDYDVGLEELTSSAIGKAENTNSPAPDERRTTVERPANLNTKYTFESFVTGSSNRFASAAALSVAETPARSYNPLFVYGAAGLGKTHLLQAIGSYVVRNYPTYRVRYISTETMMNEFIDAIRHGTQANFKRRYREIDLLLVDDVQFMEGKEQLQEEFFYTFNTLYEANRQIVLTSDRPPDKVATLEDRLRSRFKMGLVTDIQPPDFETRFAILRKKADAGGFRVPNEVLELIVNNVTNNIRELEGAFHRITAYMALHGKDITLEEAMMVLSDIIQSRQPRPITPQLIMDTTAEKYGFTIEELKAQDRRRPLVQARQICMYLFRELTELSYPQIAELFGGRDHTTIIYGNDKIKKLMQERKPIYDDVTSLIQLLKTGVPPSSSP